MADYEILATSGDSEENDNLLLLLTEKPEPPLTARARVWDTDAQAWRGPEMPIGSFARYASGWAALPPDARRFVTVEAK